MFPIVEKLGGWDVVDPLLEERGVSIGYEAKKKWRHPDRGMPWQARFALALIARQRGVDWAESDFIFHEPRMEAAE